VAGHVDEVVRRRDRLEVARVVRVRVVLRVAAEEALHARGEVVVGVHVKRVHCTAAPALSYVGVRGARTLQLHACTLLVEHTLRAATAATTYLQR
jgi:hypothetical protein